MFVDEEALFDTVERQISGLWRTSAKDIELINGSFTEALTRTENCFAHIANKYYHVDDSKGPRFDYLHSCQYTIFLYYLANKIYKSKKDNEDLSVCDKLYNLIRIVSSCDLFCQVELPDVFFCDHPLGSVLGRAQYSNYFSFSQGCTIGNNHGVYPIIGENVYMMSNSTVIGKCKIGNNVIISSGAYVKDTDIPNNSVVFGRSPQLIIKENRLDLIKEYREYIFL